MSTRFRAAVRRTRLFLVPALAVSGCLLVEPPGALKSQPTDANGGEAGSDAMNAGGSGASGKAGASATAGSAGRATGASGNGDAAGAAGESSGGAMTAGAGGGGAGQNSGGMHAGGTSGGGTAGSSAGATSGGSAGTGGAATVDPYSGNFKILILSTVASGAFPHESRFDCQNMLGHDSGVADPPAAFNQTANGSMPTGTKPDSQFTADLAADNLTDFTDTKLKNYAMVFSCNPEGTVFSNNTTHDAATGTAAMAALQKYVEGGGAWGGVHSATDFEVGGGFPWFTNVLVGAYFKSHDPYPTNDTVVIQAAAARHPVMTDLLTPYSPDEEWYTMSRVIAGRPGFQVLAALTSMNNRPVVWVRELCPNVGTGVCAPSPTNGRSFYTTRGHDKSAYKDAEFRKLVLNGILWATHRLEQQ